MITTRAMPAVHPSFLGVSHTITAAHNTHSRLCRSPGYASPHLMTRPIEVPRPVTSGSVGR
jgi:hypothetical protein